MSTTKYSSATYKATCQIWEQYSHSRARTFCYYDALVFSSKSAFAMALVTFWLGYIVVQTIAKTVSKCFLEIKEKKGKSFNILIRFIAVRPAF